MSDITAIVPTSPTPHHPEIDHLAWTVTSIRHHLPDAEIIVCADGVRPEQANLKPAYDEYLRRVIWACQREWAGVLPVLCDEWGHQANTARRALAEVRTPLVLFAEHDTPLVVEREIDWDAISSVLHAGVANVMRLHHEASILPSHAHLMLDRRDQGLPWLRTVQWSQRPHVARTLWYQNTLDRYFTPKSRTMIEDVIHGVLHSAWLDHGEAGWEEWRTWLYAPEGSMQRSIHLDSRGDAPKFAMEPAYPGATPPGAPQPQEG